MYAYHAQLSLNKVSVELTIENIERLVIRALSAIYTKEISLSTHNTVMEDENLTNFLEMLVACCGSLPISFFLSVCVVVIASS